MSRAEKLVRRLAGRPADFSWDELANVLEGFGFSLVHGPGSSRKFIHRTTKATLMMHQPHPGSILKAYQVKAAVDFLRKEGYLS